MGKKDLAKHKTKCGLRSESIIYKIVWILTLKHTS